MPGELSQEARGLLRDRIESFEQLEVLVAIVRDPGHSWTADGIAKQVGLSPTRAADALDHLCRGSLLDVRIGDETLLFRYAPGNAALDAAARELAATFDDQRSALVRLVAEDASRRGQTVALHTFAEAFVLGPKRKTRG